jgi:hypothetical protein
MRRDGRVAEGARLESVYTARYPGFESLSLRQPVKKNQQKQANSDESEAYSLLKFSLFSPQCPLLPGVYPFFELNRAKFWFCLKPRFFRSTSQGDFGSAGDFALTVASTDRPGYT